MKRIASLLLTALVSIAVGIGATAWFDTTPEFDAWKSSTDAAEAAAKTQFDAFPANPCTAGHELTKAFTDWRTAHAAKFTDLLNHSTQMPTDVCAEPAPPPTGQSNIFGRLQFEITGEWILGFSQASDCTWNRRTNEVWIIDQLNRIDVVSIVNEQLVHHRSIQILNGEGQGYSNDFEGIQYVGSTGTTDHILLLFENDNGPLFWVDVPDTATSISLGGVEQYNVNAQCEAVAFDYKTPSTVHCWTYGSVNPDKHVIVTRGSPTTHTTNSFYTGAGTSWVGGWRGSFWNTDYCPNPIKVGCNMSDVNLRELNHTNPNIPFGTIVSTASFTRSNRKFEGGCFGGSEKIIYLVAEAGGPLTNFFRTEAP